MKLFNKTDQFCTWKDSRKQSYWNDGEEWREGWRTRRRCEQRCAWGRCQTWGQRRSKMRSRFWQFPAPKGTSMHQCPLKYIHEKRSDYETNLDKGPHYSLNSWQWWWMRSWQPWQRYEQHLDQCGQLLPLQTLTMSCRAGGGKRWQGDRLWSPLTVLEDLADQLRR